MDSKYIYKDSSLLDIVDSRDDWALDIYISDEQYNIEDTPLYGIPLQKDSNKFLKSTNGVFSELVTNYWGNIAIDGYQILNMFLAHKLSTIHVDRTVGTDMAVWGGDKVTRLSVSVSRFKTTISWNASSNRGEVVQTDEDTGQTIYTDLPVGCETIMIDLQASGGNGGNAEGTYSTYSGSGGGSGAFATLLIHLPSLPTTLLIQQTSSGSLKVYSGINTVITLGAGGNASNPEGSAWSSTDDKASTPGSGGKATQNSTVAGIEVINLIDGAEGGFGDHRHQSGLDLQGWGSENGNAPKQISTSPLDQTINYKTGGFGQNHLGLPGQWSYPGGGGGAAAVGGHGGNGQDYTGGTASRAGTGGGGGGSHAYMGIHADGTDNTCISTSGGASLVNIYYPKIS